MIPKHAKQSTDGRKQTTKSADEKRRYRGEERAQTDIDKAAASGMQ